MKDREFLAVEKRYYNWKSMQAKDENKTPTEMEQTALEWGYEAGRADMEKHVRDRLFRT